MPESSESENHVNRMMVGDGFQNWFVNIRKPEKLPAFKHCNAGQPGSLHYENIFTVIYPENGS